MIHAPSPGSSEQCRPSIRGIATFCPGRTGPNNHLATRWSHVLVTTRKFFCELFQVDASPRDGRITFAWSSASTVCSEMLSSVPVVSGSSCRGTGPFRIRKIKHAKPLNSQVTTLFLRKTDMVWPLATPRGWPSVVPSTATRRPRAGGRRRSVPSQVLTCSIFRFLRSPHQGRCGNARQVQSRSPSVDVKTPTRRGREGRESRRNTYRCGWYG